MDINIVKRSDIPTRKSTVNEPLYRTISSLKVEEALTLSFPTHKEATSKKQTIWRHYKSLFHEDASIQINQRGGTLYIIKTGVSQ